MAQDKKTRERRAQKLRRLSRQYAERAELLETEGEQRTTFDLPANLHARLKAAARSRGCDMQDIVIEALEAVLQE